MDKDKIEIQLEQAAAEVSRTKELGNELLRELLAGSRSHSLIEAGRKWTGTDIELTEKDFYLVQVQEITYEDDYPQKEAMENVLGSFRGMDGVSFIYLLLGDGTKVDFYLGIAKDKYNDENAAIDAQALTKQLLMPSLRGNFRGCKLKEITSAERKEILARLKNEEKCRYTGLLEGVPGVDSEAEDFQGAERLVDVMQGSRFGLVVIARPYTDTEVDDIARDLYRLSDRLAPLVRHSLQWSAGGGASASVSAATQHGFSEQTATQDSESDSSTATRDSRKDSSTSLQEGTTDNNSIQGILDSKSDTYINKETQKENHSSTSNSGTTRTTSVQSGTTRSCATAESESSQQAQQSSKGTSHTDTKSWEKQISENQSNQSNENYTKNEQLEVENRAAADWLKYIEEVLLPRLDNGRGKGLFQCCAYLIAERKVSLYRLANTLQSLYSGPQGNKSALYFTDLSRDSKYKETPRKSLQQLQIPQACKCDTDSLEGLVAYSRWLNESKGTVDCGSWLSANELGLLAGLPQKEVVGLKLREEVEFGLNIEPVPEKDRLPLGKLVQSGVETDIDVVLSRPELDKHTFVTGVTGSGKTTTCQRILQGAKCPFLVIEPAKTEYRSMLRLGECKDLLVFTPGKTKAAPFFLNPFELFPGEAISSRADMLKATFEAAFEMEAAIPQLMETAIYRAYENKGWNISSDEWYASEDAWEPADPYAEGVYAFPTLSDYKIAVEEMVDISGFSDRLRDEYLGSINARLESLLVGAKGAMFNTPRSVDFADLVERQVVIELEEIKNGAEKSLLMGFILINLQQAVKAKWENNNEYQHITLVEEAHRLLSKVMPGDSPHKKQGVEVFADMLAEIRKYGESLIIVDQIPEKMTPEVLKNTNTKLVHKLFAQDDKDAIGNTMALDEEQKKFLSSLTPGRAIMFSQGWSKAVQVQVARFGNDDKNEMIRDEELRKKAICYYGLKKNAERGVVPGLAGLKEEERTPALVERYLDFLLNQRELLDMLREMVRKKALPGEKKNRLCDLLGRGLRRLEQSELKELLLRMVPGLRGREKCAEKDFENFLEVLSQDNMEKDDIDTALEIFLTRLKN